MNRSTNQNMCNVLDVASYILAKQGPMTTMKLQKLVYYAQAWSLVWDEKPLFRSKIEALANGPVVPALYKFHKGQFKVRRLPFGDGRRIIRRVARKRTLDAVLAYYGKKSSQWLSNLTHSERPWKDARKGLSPRTRGNREITHEAMAWYYSSL